MCIRINLPAAVKEIISVLECNGFVAFVVGGCVRDSILGRPTHDWDICTSATPNELIRVFDGYNCMKVGLQFGTLSARIREEIFEVTTFRSDGDYSDGRHPDSVALAESLEEDLQKRDFTINAMAYSDKEGLVDVVGGLQDLQDGVIRCVGNAEKRFQEDALRVLRAIRFATVLNFCIDQSVRDAIHSKYTRLRNVSIERVNSEFCKMIVCPNFGNMLREYSSIFSFCIPELNSMIGFDQNNKYHIYDLFEHTLCALENCESNDLVLRLAVFFHDFGKPYSYQDGEDGYRHFKGHGKVGASIVDGIMQRFRFDSSVQKKVVELVFYHDAEIAVGKKFAKRWLNRIGLEQFQKLLALKKADSKAHATNCVQRKLECLQAVEDCLQEVLCEQECFTLKDLAVNGKDLIGIGFKQGRTIGITLDSLLQKVINGEIENERSVLLSEAKGYK